MISERVIIDEWALLQKKNEALLKERELALYEQSHFKESDVAKNILERKDRLENIASQVQLSLSDCEEILRDFTKLSDLCESSLAHNQSVEALNKKTVEAERNGITPYSQTEISEKLRKLAQEKYKESKILTKSYKEIIKKIENQYYQVKKDRAEVFIDIFWQNLSLFYRFVMYVLFILKIAFRERKHYNNLTAKARFFFGETFIIKYKLVMWQNLLFSQIDQSRKEYQQAKIKLKSTVEQANIRLQVHREKETLWACQDKERLECYLKDNRALRASTIERFVKEHPDVDVSWLHYESNPSQTKVQIVRHGRRKNQSINNPSCQSVQCQEYRWDLIICDDNAKNETPLPSLEDITFPEKLKNAMSSFGCQAEVADVVRKLREITAHSPELLRRRKRVSYAEPKGWKIFRFGKFRIIMDITQSPEDLTIKAVFLIRKRDKAY